MKWPGCFLVNQTKITAGLILLLLCFTSVGAQEKQPIDRLLQARYSMAGLRLGFWGDMTNEKPSQDLSVEANLPSAGFYTEIYIDYRVAKPLFVELSAGVASRGEIVILDAGNKYIGNINLYPVLLQLKYSPLSGRSRSVCPFVEAGGGFVFGRQSIDIVMPGDYYEYNPDITGKTETDFIGAVGGGVDLALSEQLGLNIAAKYHPVKFVNSLAGIREYSGISISVGVSYFLHKL